MEDTNKENLHDEDTNSTESISNSSIVNSRRRMLELFDNNALDKMEELLVVDIVLANEHKEPVARRFKIHLKRVDWEAHVNYLVHACVFAKTYRMPLRAFNHLVDLLWDMVSVDEHKSQQSTSSESVPIFPELVVAVEIRTMAGLDYAALKDWSGISAGSYQHCLDMFLQAIQGCNSPMLAITWPATESQLRQSAAAFHQIATEHVVFKHLISAMDSMLVWTIQPAHVPNPRSYFSGHYECFGLNLQAVCDALLCFIYAGIGGPGATPDVTAFCTLTINEMVEHLSDPYYVVGDAAYIPTEQMTTPYTGLAQEEYWKDVYNFYLSQMQSASRWRLAN
jgi:DDE superfamily endonuclease